MSQLPPAAAAALDAVDTAAVELESRRAYGKPLLEIVAGLEHLQEKMNAARVVLYPLLEKTLETGQCPQ